MLPESLEKIADKIKKGDVLNIPTTNRQDMERVILSLLASMFKELETLKATVDEVAAKSSQKHSLFGGKK